MNKSAIYSNLPVYRDCYAITLEFEKIRPSLPRDVRYTLAQDLSHALVGLMVTIYRANSSRSDKVRLIAEMRRMTVEVQIFFRLLGDLHHLGVKREAYFLDKVESIGKQLAAWHKSTVRENERFTIGAISPSTADGRPECGGPRLAAASRKESSIRGAVAPGATHPAANGGLTANTGVSPWR